ncbi:hypothetical protein JAAARDRAFT_35551 [Jaapia argillacea MUCL 33604]|uniref:Uncharacterized protein n=1 Tax=Jaapia argillacea MUCL 33604 TaxID=933084 RepID=A0A067PQ66_9AGAM|nr:hypothetical protein JAAARDRAFT_35551 [Jaapia argillacea MUCL 33604]
MYSSQYFSSFSLNYGPLRSASKAPSSPASAPHLTTSSTFTDPYSPSRNSPSHAAVPSLSTTVPISLNSRIDPYLEMKRSNLSP